MKITRTGLLLRFGLPAGVISWVATGSGLRMEVRSPRLCRTWDLIALVEVNDGEHCKAWATRCPRSPSSSAACRGRYEFPHPAERCSQQSHPWRRPRAHTL